MEQVQHLPRRRVGAVAGDVTRLAAQVHVAVDIVVELERRLFDLAARGQALRRVCRERVGAVAAAANDVGLELRSASPCGVLNGVVAHGLDAAGLGGRAACRRGCSRRTGGCAVHPEILLVRGVAVRLVPKWSKLREQSFRQGGVGARGSLTLETTRLMYIR